jgi:hypothetical protein
MAKGNKIRIEDDTLSSLFMIGKSLAFQSVKFSYINKICEALPTNSEQPSIDINRGLIMHRKDKGRLDNHGEWTTFGLLCRTFKERNFEYLRIPNSNSQAWRANMVGEGSIDQGGPYRESICNMIDELYSPCLPLLIPTQNSKNDHGQNRDCYTINPSSVSPTHLEMYKFLGALIGMAFRSGTVMDLKFPALVWKKLIGEPLDIEDLNGSDAYAVQAIRDLQKSKAQFSDQMFNEYIDLNFTTQLSNGETVELCEGGYEKKVTRENVEEYNSLVLDARFDEGTKQIEAMKEGFNVIFPVNILNILTWKDVETRVRGPSEITVQALKSITEYTSSSADNEYVLRFWRVFEEFTQDERSMFLKFVWGRSRLPPDERIQEQKFKIFLMDQSKFENHDLHFPESHTCFFQFDLPRYTTDDSAKAKILYAITACGEIDTDNSSYSIADAGGDYDSD